MRRPEIGLVSAILVLSLSLFLLCPSFSLGQVSSRAAERAALLQLRSSLGIRSRDWPRKSDPCSAWSDIQCDGNGNVVGINISGFRRTRIGARNPQFSVDALVNLIFLAEAEG